MVCTRIERDTTPHHTHDRRRRRSFQFQSPGFNYFRSNVHYSKKFLKNPAARKIQQGRIEPTYPVTGIDPENPFRPLEFWEEPIKEDEYLTQYNEKYEYPLIAKDFWQLKTKRIQRPTETFWRLPRERTWMERDLEHPHDPRPAHDPLTYCILREDVADLGVKGDVVAVDINQFREDLHPNRVAVVATRENCCLLGVCVRGQSTRRKKLPRKKSSNNNNILYYGTTSTPLPAHRFPTTRCTKTTSGERSRASSCSASRGCGTSCKASRGTSSRARRRTRIRRGMCAATSTRNPTHTHTHTGTSRGLAKWRGLSLRQSLLPCGRRRLQRRRQSGMPHTFQDRATHTTPHHTPHHTHAGKNKKRRRRSGRRVQPWRCSHCEHRTRTPPSNISEAALVLLRTTTIPLRPTVTHHCANTIRTRTRLRFVLATLSVLDNTAFIFLFHPPSTSFLPLPDRSHVGKDTS